MPDPILRDFARRLRSLRALRGVTREQIQELTGLAANTIKGWEIGRFGSKGPTILDVITLARYYGVSIDWLLGFADDEIPLPPGYELADMGLVERISKVTELSQLGEEVSGPDTVVWSIPIPPLRKVFHPEDPRLQEIAEETDAKLEELRRKD